MAGNRTFIVSPALATFVLSVVLMPVRLEPSPKNFVAVALPAVIFYNVFQKKGGDIEEQACKRGIHFFVEKPVAVNMEIANRVAKAVRDSGVPLTRIGTCTADRSVLIQLTAEGDATALPGGRVDAPQLAIVRTAWQWHQAHPRGYGVD